jgi:hypothetical protein
LQFEESLDRREGSETDLLRESSKRDRRALVFRASRQSLPELFSDVRHEGVEETETLVQAGVESLLSGESDFGSGSFVRHRLDGLLHSVNIKAKR